MVQSTNEKVNDLINRLLQGKYIDDMTKNGFHKLPIHPEYQHSIRLQKSTNLNHLVDPASSRVVTALLREYPHL